MMVCINWCIASLSLFMSLNAHSRARTRSGLSASGSSIMSFGDIGAEWNSRLAGERGFSEGVCAEPEESEAGNGEYGVLRESALCRDSFLL